MDKEFVFDIVADYRPRNPNKPHYYAVGKNKKEVKKRFESTFCGLKVYSVEKCEKEIAENLLSDRKNLLFTKVCY